MRAALDVDEPKQQQANNTEKKGRPPLESRGQPVWARHREAFGDDF